MLSEVRFREAHMSNVSPTVSAEIKSALSVLQTVAEAIRDAGEIPSGHLYAVLMGMGCSLENYNRILGMLTRSGLVEVTPGHLVRWVAPLYLK